MSTLDTYARFLTARWDEVETAAKAATAGPWRYDPTKVNSISREESVFAGDRGPSATTIASTGPEDDPQSMDDARHIALHNPAHVLADLAAKRAILAAHQPEDDEGAKTCSTCLAHVNPSCGDWECEAWPCKTVAALAAPFRDHPDHPANQ